MPRLPHAQQGIALLTALLVMAIAVMVAAAVISTQHYDVKIQTNIQQLERAYQYTSGIEQMAGLWLQRDLKLNQTDSLLDTWATTLPEMPIKDGETVIGSFSGKMEDLQGLFNLNTLLDDKGNQTDLGQTLFDKLIKAQTLPAHFRLSVTDWMDKDSATQHANSAEADFYMTSKPAYFAANQPFADPSELFLVRLDSLAPEETRKKLDELLKISSALPSKAFTKININTAPEALLQILVPNDVQMIVATRQNQPYDQDGLNNFITTTSSDLKKEFQSIIPNPNYKPAQGDKPEEGEPFNKLQWSNVFGVTSNYFRLRGLIKIGSVRLNTISLLERTESGEIRILMRRFEYTTEQNQTPSELSPLDLNQTAQ
ncbi:MAG: type II secretion system minor pseudopilin GspK [Thiofilum sp.]|uniref:type II secretion system minor pseudopilin GspK n=1 Tax=Thiofilum sp. TaxID=2212733 RepID=UPI0025FDB32F|nr:type II secretion system minor pseudopilin GspK [Thiofilum sp.]MBK8452214.1 type II secretion system minor pseudopilin GspK [Thiofilum sp.]